MIREHHSSYGSSLSCLEGADSTADIFTSALQASLRKVPYNSASQFHKFFGENEADPRLGVACVFQTFDAADRAVVGGASAPTFLRHGRHVAAVFEDDGDLVVLDPYLLHSQPLRFPAQEVADGSSLCESPAAPYRQGGGDAVNPGRLVGRYRSTADGYEIRLEYSKYSPSKGHYVLSRYFALPSTSRITPAGPFGEINEMLTHPEQTSLSLRTVSADLLSTHEAILPLRGYAQKEFTRHDIWLRDSQGVTAPFDSDHTEATWQALQEATGATKDAIVEHLLSASQLYAKIAGPHRDLAEYSLGNE